MARSSAKRRIGPSGKIVLLAVCVVIGIGVYTAGWYYLAGQLAARTERLIAGLAADDVAVECANMEVRGYPFRLGVFCDGVRAETSNSQIATLSTSAFRSAAQIYRPNHIVSELDGPMTAILDDGTTLAADWQTLRSSSVFNTSGLARASLEGTAVTGTLQDTGLSADAQGVSLHTRRNGPDLDLAVRAEGARIDGAWLSFDLPQFDIVGEAVVTDGAEFLSGRSISVEELRGTSGQLVNAAAAIDGGGRMTLSGPFEIDESGLLSGEFELGIERLADWQALVSGQLPALRETVDTAAGMLRTLGGGETVSVTLNVRQGRASLGLIPLGRIPPI